MFVPVMPADLLLFVDRISENGQPGAIYEHLLYICGDLLPILDLRQSSVLSTLGGAGAPS